MDSLSNMKVTSKTVSSIEYNWLISDDYCKCTWRKDFFSPIFPQDPTQEATIQWKIKMERSEKTVNTKIVKHIGLWLYASSQTISSVNLAFAFDMHWNSTSFTCNKTCNFKTYKLDPAKEAAKWTKIDGWSEVYSDGNHDSYGLSYNTLKSIRCTIDIVGEQKEAPIESLFYTIPSGCLQQSLETLLTTGMNADITLVAKDDDQKLKAHKAILMVRSPVFNAMFSNQMSESLDKLVVFEDIQFDVLNEMVRFIYTGNVSNLSAVADRLLMAADKYDLPTLRAMCEQQMGINLSVENAAQTLILADLHQAGQLKKFTLRFIKHHALQVMATDGWKEILAKHPNLLNLVLNDVCQLLTTLQQ